MINSKILRIFVSAGEASGDYLAAQIFEALKNRYSNINAVGVTGPKMREAGIRSWHDISTLSVMGFSAVISKLAQIKQLQNQLLIEIERFKPHIAILVDYQSFHLTLGEQIKLRNIPTILCVAPQVWAWRQERAYYLKDKVDLILGILPFESDFFKQFNVPFKYIGSPILERIQSIPPSQILYSKKQSVGMFPGSRVDEFNYTFPHMWKIGRSLEEKNISVRINVAPNLKFEKISRSFLNEGLSPKLINETLRKKGIFYFKNMSIDTQNSLQSMIEVDFALVTSGTATLECALTQTPMAVIYVASKINYFLAKKLVKIPYISLPNLIFNDNVIKEFIQDIDHNKIKKHILKHLEKKTADQLKIKLKQLHSLMKKNASQNAAQEIVNILDKTMN